MKFDDTFTFKMESPDGDAVITCQELPLDIIHEIQAVMAMRKEGDSFSPELTRRYETAICESVVNIIGLSDGRGEVTVERLRTKKIARSLLSAIIVASLAAKKAMDDTEEKKTDSKAE